MAGAAVTLGNTDVTDYQHLSDYVNEFMRIKPPIDPRTDQPIPIKDTKRGNQANKEFWKLKGSDFENAHVSLIRNQWPYGTGANQRYLIHITDESKALGTPERNFYRDVVRGEWVEAPPAGGAQVTPLARRNGDLPLPGPAKVLWAKLVEDKRFRAQVDYDDIYDGYDAYEGANVGNDALDYDRQDALVYPVYQPEAISHGDNVLLGFEMVLGLELLVMVMMVSALCLFIGCVVGVVVYKLSTKSSRKTKVELLCFACLVRRIWL